jgi:predicted Holliday junction resolvase-like endonuclease
MDSKEITEVVFVEVKTGKSTLNPVEKKLRDAIKEKRVDWREYRTPEETASIPQTITVDVDPVSSTVPPTS